VRGDICAICCGTERENTVDCPFDCVYLREARAREKPIELDASAASIPFYDIRVPAGFLREHAAIAQLVAEAVAKAVFATPGAIDYDLREALEALIRTYKTLQSGLVYESRPNNPVAAHIFEVVQKLIDDGRKQVASKTGVTFRDGEVMAMLLIMQRQEYRFNNGRKRGRAYLDRLRKMIPEDAASVAPSTSPLIV
jgi:hypothetical protein